MFLFQLVGGFSQSATPFDYLGLMGVICALWFFIRPDASFILNYESDVKDRWDAEELVESRWPRMYSTLSKRISKYFVMAIEVPILLETASIICIAVFSTGSSMYGTIGDMQVVAALLHMWSIRCDSVCVIFYKFGVFQHAVLAALASTVLALLSEYSLHRYQHEDKSSTSWLLSILVYCSLAHSGYNLFYCVLAGYAYEEVELVQSSNRTDAPGGAADGNSYDNIRQVIGKNRNGRDTVLYANIRRVLVLERHLQENPEQ